MRPKTSRPGPGSRSFHCLLAILAVALLSPGYAVAQPDPKPAESQVLTTTTTDATEAPKIPNDQLDSLVAPIALYPDPLLAQTLAASTYPLEVIQLQQWMQQNKSLKGKALADAVAKQKWDPSVQSMAGIPEAVQRLAGNIQWTTDLGNAFLAQQQDVFDAIQRMRAKAQSKGALKTSQEQTVETQTVQGGKEVIVIQQPNPEVVYVPSYDPAVVYGPPAYPYYPYTYPGYVPGMGLALGAGIIAGGIWANNNWGNCNWGNGDININNNNNFNRNNINRGQGGSGKWQHNAQHRGNAPYGDRGTANRFGGNARQQPGGVGGVGGAGRAGGAGGLGGAGGVGRPGGAGGAGGIGKPGGAGGAGRPGGAGGAGRPGGAGGVGRPGGAGGVGKPGGAGGARPSTRPASRPSGGNNIGSQNLGGSRGGGGSFGGGGGGSYNRASSSRGGHSMGGGGFSGGGGRGGGGGGRGGGGGGRRR